MFEGNQSLRGKVALITGSTSGIGLGAAHVLAKQGINIVLNGLMPEGEGEALAGEFREQYGIKAMFNGADLSDPESIEQLMDHAVTEMGSIDILVNNAGIQHTESIENFPKAKWDAIIAINLSSAFHTMQKALPIMQKNGWGRIINIASVHGLVASLNKSAYVAAKHGIVGLTKVAALENAGKGITANSVCPGWVETPLINKQIEDVAAAQGVSMEEARVKLITAKQPLPEMAQPSQIGELILFLCSDAAKGITGASLPIDGAWTAQ
jgi:3-hydroxybutyrate dehydrogenase